MSCDEKFRLGKECEETTASFAIDEAEYERLQRASDEARMKSEQARLALEQRIAAHGC